ncbi:hypothetical protein J2746_002437 [Methanolobus bombayensis]|nr:hypothetical protein [Methanolobus bombayensis]
MTNVCTFLILRDAIAGQNIISRCHVLLKPAKRATTNIINRYKDMTTAIFVLLDLIPPFIKTQLPNINLFNK